jgi:hypothetical protein
MVVGNYTSSRNKNMNIKIRKQFRRTQNYVCCIPAPGNSNKEHAGFSCTCAKFYTRLDNKLLSHKMALDPFEYYESF